MLTYKQERIVQDLVSVLRDNNLLQKVMFIGSCSEYFYEKCYILPSHYRFTASTADIDLCIKNVYAAQRPTDFSRRLLELGYTRKTDRITGAVKFEYDGNVIEFLTPRRGDGRDPYPRINSLGLNAVEIKYMEILTHNVICVDYKMGTNKVSVNIPHPAAYALHKMVYNKDRSKLEKRIKDIRAIVRVTDALLSSDTLRGSLPQIYSALSTKQQKAVQNFLTYHNGKILGINSDFLEPFTLDTHMLEPQEIKILASEEQNIHNITEDTADLETGEGQDDVTEDWGWNR